MRRKKILLIPDNQNKPDLGALFKDYLSQPTKSKTNSLLGFDDDVDWINMTDDEYWEYMYRVYGDQYGYCNPSSTSEPKSNKSKEKRKEKNHKKEKKGKYSGLINKQSSSSSSNDVALSDYYTSLHTAKTIYYYRDYENPDDYEVYTNLSDFLDFLDSEGISYTINVYNELILNDVIHCCINPTLKHDLHDNYLMVEETYANLRWECQS